MGGSGPSQLTPEYAARMFVGTPAGEIIEARMSHAVSAAYDIADDGGLNMEKVLPLLIAAERPGSPMNPEQLARKLVRLAGAARP